MKLDLKLLSTRFFQAEEGSTTPDTGVNRYLIDQVLTPILNGETLYLRDIDFSAFDADDVETLQQYHERMNIEMRKLNQFATPVSQTRPVPARARTFC